MNEKGFVHTIEAILAGFILISFLVVIYNFTPAMQQTLDEKKYTYSILRSLDRLGKLRGAYLEENLTLVEERLSGRMPDRFGFCTGMKIQDGYSGGNLTFHVPGDFSVDWGILEIYNTTDESTATLNGNQIDLAGDWVRIPSDYFNASGTNEFNQTDLDYKLKVIRSRKDCTLPNQNVKVVSYPLSGKNDRFKPGILRVYVW